MTRLRSLVASTGGVGGGGSTHNTYAHCIEGDHTSGAAEWPLARTGHAPDPPGGPLRRGCYETDALPVARSRASCCIARIVIASAISPRLIMATVSYTHLTLPTILRV